MWKCVMAATVLSVTVSGTALAASINVLNAGGKDTFTFTAGSQETFANGAYNHSSPGITVYGISMRKSNSLFELATDRDPVTVDTGGVGVLSQGENITCCNGAGYLVDDGGEFRDFLVLELDASEWRGVSATFTGLVGNAPIYNVYGYDGSIDFSSAAAMQSLYDSNEFDSLGSGSASTFVFTSNNKYQSFIFAADDMDNGNNGNIDRFRLESFTGVSAVPVPAAFPLLATALGGLGFLSWRKKQKSRRLVRV